MENQYITFKIIDKGGNTLVTEILDDGTITEEKYESIKNKLKELADKNYEDYRICVMCEKKKPDTIVAIDDEKNYFVICRDCEIKRQRILKILNERMDESWDNETKEKKKSLKK